MEELTFGEELSLLRRRKGLTQDALAKKAGILREMVSNYESDKVYPREETLKRIAEVLDVNYNDLFRLLDDKRGMEKKRDKTQTFMGTARGNKIVGIEEIEEVLALPVLNSVHAGDPHMISESEIIDVIKLPRKIAMSSDYALEVEGLSMIDAGIGKGDIVTVKIQPAAENNNIVIARIDDKFTLKRFKKNEKGEVWLEPANHDYDPIKGTPFEIVGIIKYVIKKM